MSCHPRPRISLSLPLLLLGYNTGSVCELVDLTNAKPKAKKYFPGPESIGNAEYDELRNILTEEVERKSLHLKFVKKENKTAWIAFYQQTFFAKDGALVDLFAPYQKKDPEVKFRANIFKGIEIDAAKYEARIASGEEPENLPDVLRRAYKLHMERTNAQHAIDNENMALKAKLDKARSDKERNEVRFGLRAAGTVTPSPVAGNPASLLGKQPSFGESLLAVPCFFQLNLNDLTCNNII